MQGDTPVLHMKRYLRRGRVWGLLGIGLLVIVVYFWRQQEPFVAEVMLPHGKHKLRLLQLTDGPLDYEWRSPFGFLPTLAARSPVRLPNWFGKILPPVSVHLDGESRYPDVADRASFLFRVVDLKGRYATAITEPLKIYFMEESGYAHSIAYVGNGVRGGGTYAFTAATVPRRDRELRIRVEQDNYPEPVEMRVPNPFFKSDAEVWTAQPLPATKTVGTMTATIKGFKIVQRWPNSKVHCIAEPVVDVTSSIPGEFQGAKFGHIYYDATGNTSFALSPFEQAWKIRFNAYRDSASTFPLEWVQSIGTFTLPNQGELQTLDQPIRIDGLDLTVRCLAGAGLINSTGGKLSALLPQNGVLSNDAPAGPPMLHMRAAANGPTASKTNVPEFGLSCGAPCLLIEFPSPHAACYFMVRAYQDNKLLPPLLSTRFDLGAKCIVAAAIPLPAQTGNVRLEVVVNRGEAFEFLVEPPQELRDLWLESNNEPLWPSLNLTPVSSKP